jgi:omega-hydroxy-beta-dihydromenaquinone-9 sulfotransferase
MSVLRGEDIRVFLVNWLFTPLQGMSLGETLRLLSRHRFAVDPRYWPRAAFLMLGSVLTSAFAWYEECVYGPHFRGVDVKSPVFILGHWRSGTTFLHNLLTIDPQFAYASLWQALNPHTFLTTERYGKLVRMLAPKTRLTDNVGYRADSPLEDQFATNGTLCSPFLRWVFPCCADYYDRYLTFQGVPRAELEQWKAALLLFYQKLTWKYGRPLLLKSPPHTCRIKLLLDMFPDARFIHIARNPYSIFRSTRRQVEVSFLTTCLQRSRPPNLDDWIIQRYKTMYGAFFRDRDLIPAGQFCEVRFEDLICDPVGWVGRIYKQLSIAEFDSVQPALQRYVDSLQRYRANEYAALPPALRHNIAEAWRRSFEIWGYAC